MQRLPHCRSRFAGNPPVSHIPNQHAAAVRFQARYRRRGNRLGNPMLAFLRRRSPANHRRAGWLSPGQPAPHRGRAGNPAPPPQAVPSRSAPAPEFLLPLRLPLPSRYATPDRGSGRSSLQAQAAGAVASGCIWQTCGCTHGSPGPGQCASWRAAASYRAQLAGGGACVSAAHHAATSSRGIGCIIAIRLHPRRRKQRTAYLPL